MAQRITLGALKQQERQKHIARSARVVSLGMGALVSAVTLLIVCVVALGSRNGLWMTGGQAESQFRHEYFPVAAARKGFVEPLEAENRLRQQSFRAQLAVPMDRHQRAAAQRATLNELQAQLRSR